MNKGNEFWVVCDKHGFPYVGHTCKSTAIFLACCIHIWHPRHEIKSRAWTWKQRYNKGDRARKIILPNIK